MAESRPDSLPSILKTIIADKAVRLRDCKGRTPQSELERRCRDLPRARDFRAALDPRSPAIIAEFKRRSPSRGVIRSPFDLQAIHRSYRRAGADAYSVLTEEDHFGGSLGDLGRLRELAEVPLLRKDFLFDPYQIYESRVAGADALLLIVATLDDGQLRELISLSRELTMEALVEVHTAPELHRALECGAAIVGINNRDLHTFRVDLSVTLELAPHLPGTVIGVAESGISGPEDIRRLRRAGIHAFLVGEQLMRADDPGRELERLKEVS